MTPRHRAALIARFAEVIAQDDAARGFWSERPDAPPCDTYAARLAYLRHENAEPWDGDLERFLRGFGGQLGDREALVRSWRHYLAQRGPK